GRREGPRRDRRRGPARGRRGDRRRQGGSATRPGRADDQRLGGRRLGMATELNAPAPHASREMTYRTAVARAIAQEMTRDPAVVFLGEDVGDAGGVFKATEGLFAQFGPDRVRDTPISEQAILGAAMGAAMTGLRPIAEVMFSDFFAVCWDMVANQI